MRLFALLLALPLLTACSIFPEPRPPAVEHDPTPTAGEVRASPDGPVVAVGAEAAPAAAGKLRRGVHRLRRHPRLRAVIDRLHALYRLPHHVHTLKTLQEEQARLRHHMDALAAAPAAVAPEKGQGGAEPRLQDWYQDFEDHFRG
ncbi:MAG: hypothetical protein ACLFQD_09610, partial [Thiohalospira sp.]